MSLTDIGISFFIKIRRRSVDRPLHLQPVVQTSKALLRAVFVRITAEFGED